MQYIFKDEALVKRGSDFFWHFGRACFFWNVNFKCMLYRKQIDKWTLFDQMMLTCASRKLLKVRKDLSGFERSMQQALNMERGRKNGCTSLQLLQFVLTFLSIGKRKQEEEKRKQKKERNISLLLAPLVHNFK